MVDDHDYYEILHVHPDAPVEIIRASYKVMMQRLKLHPDLGGDHDHAALINSAYDALKNEARRAAYDKQREGARRSSPPQPAARSKSRYSQSIEQCAFCGTPHRYGSTVPVEAQCSVCQSPLRPARSHEVTGADLRAIERLPKRQIIRFYTGWPGHPHTGCTRDISLNGMQFETLVSLERNQLLKVDCDVCRVTARVAHTTSEAELCIAGVEFITLRFEQTQGTFVSTRV